MIDYDSVSSQVKIENSALRSKIVEAYHQSKQRDHQRILGRHKAIEERKEYLEKLSIHREAAKAREVRQWGQSKAI